MCTDEIRQAKELWVRRAQKRIPQDTETPGWRLVEDKETGVLKCVGRIPGYRPTYLEDCLLTQKLIRHIHSEIKHLGVSNTGRNKKKMVDSKTKIESEENGQHVQRLQGFQHETLWGYSNSRHATVLVGSKQTLWDYRSRFCRTYRFQDRKEGAGKVLHFAVHLRYVEGDTFRIDEDPDGRRISEKVKLVHSQENKAQGHDIS